MILALKIACGLRKEKKQNKAKQNKTKRPSSNCLTCNRPFQIFFFNFFRGHVRENTSVDYVAKFDLLKTNGDKESQSREILKTDVLVYGVGHKLAAQRTNFFIFSPLSGAISISLKTSLSNLASLLILRSSFQWFRRIF